MIKVDNLTIKYSNKKGIENINFHIKKGQITGYLGPNGAGKTTTIRVLLGFMRQDYGNAFINGLDCFEFAKKIQKNIGYIPGETSFPDMTGKEFLNLIASMRNLKSLTRRDELLNIFELDPSGKIKKFSKGMKQKLAIVTAFMHEPSILILDEPTSGLDPVMQNRFVNLLLEEKKKGCTILMSSHIFEEIEKTCDNVLIIKEGKLVMESDITSLKKKQINTYEINYNKELENDLKKFRCIRQGDCLEVSVNNDEINQFIKIISKYDINEFKSKNRNLENVFMDFYDGGGR